MMYSKHNIRPKTSKISRSSLTEPGEATVFAHAWCDVVERMTRHQLRDQADDLKDLFLIAIGDGLDIKFSESNNSREAREELRKSLKKLARDYRPRRIHVKCKIDRRVDWLANSLGLDEVHCAILALMSRTEVYDEWKNLLDTISGRNARIDARQISLITGLSAPLVEDRLAPNGRLCGTGLIDFDGDGELSASNFLLRIARSSSAPARLARQLMPSAAKSTLSWTDFDHIGPQCDIAQKLVESEGGVNILLYGPPGTGKSEFARLLAERCQKKAIFAGLSDDSGGEPHRNERLAHLAILRGLTRKDNSRLIIMDEADDILTLGVFNERGGRSKMFLNRLIEEGARPTIWIINEQRCLEESILRRMSIAIEFPRPPLPVRERIVMRSAKKAQIALTDNETRRLASLPAAPALIANAFAQAKRAGGGAVEALKIADGLITAIEGRPPLPVKLPTQYDPSLAMADIDLNSLASKLEKATSQEWSLQLSGPSGTGKSAFARHLAQRLGLDLIEKRGSDLLGMYVGETEANMARAFAEAARSNAILLIDEADDFLSNRREAQRSWERSMVNEMLRQMEELQSPFIATTNLAECLDPATQRRFTLQVKFRPLDRGRASALFRHYFRKSIPEGTELRGQTPGDFAVVAKRATLLGETDPIVLTEWLKGEAALRGHGKGVIGF